MEEYKMSKEKYIAYVGTYTHGPSEGIHIYDMDIENGRIEQRKVVKINNPSYLTRSHNGKYLYSIADEGVKAYKILEDGDLEVINSATISGMRGCYLETDPKDKLLFVGGYHDGKVTVLRLQEDGSVGEVLDSVYHKGLGSVAERNFRPHVSCVTLTPDGNYLCATDLGVDHVKIYKINRETGKIKLADFLRCELESAPRSLLFSKDGNFAYLLCELKSYINVYSYRTTKQGPKFELLQTVSTLNRIFDDRNAGAALRLSADGKYLFCSNAGDDSVGAFRVDKKSGLLEKMCILPISGGYPKDIGIFPGEKHLISLNHETNSITFFTMDYKKGVFVENGVPLAIDTPNCVLIAQV